MPASQESRAPRAGRLRARAPRQPAPGGGGRRPAGPADRRRSAGACSPPAPGATGSRAGCPRPSGPAPRRPAAAPGAGVELLIHLGDDGRSGADRPVPHECTSNVSSARRSHRSSPRAGGVMPTVFTLPPSSVAPLQRRAGVSPVAPQSRAACAPHAGAMETHARRRHCLVHGRSQIALDLQPVMKGSGQANSVKLMALSP